MALNVTEQIAALEEQFNMLKGPGSKAKKRAVRAEIKELEKSLQPAEEETESLAEPEETPEPVFEVAEGWAPATEAEVIVAEKEGLLYGWDPDRGIALILKAKKGEE